MTTMTGTAATAATAAMGAATKRLRPPVVRSDATFGASDPNQRTRHPEAGPQLNAACVAVPAIWVPVLGSPSPG
jgi:hypothetical protein